MSKYITGKDIESVIENNRDVIEAGSIGEISVYITGKNVCNDMSTVGDCFISVQMLQGAAKLLEALNGVTKVMIDSSADGAVMGTVIDNTVHQFIWDGESWK